MVVNGVYLFTLLLCVTVTLSCKTTPGNDVDPSTYIS